MKLFKPIRTGFLSRIVLHAGQPHLAVALLHYFPFAEPRRIGLEQDMWAEIMPVLGDQILDPCDPKPRAEVLVHGACIAPAGQRIQRGEVRLTVDKAIDKRLTVTGNREWIRPALGRLHASAPLPFERMPLDWSRAYGGKDYDGNPDGIGHWPRSNGSQSRFPLPNLEYPDDPMRLPDQEIRPAAMGPRPITLPARRKLAGTYDAYWAKHHEPGYPRDIRPEFFLTAPPDQVMPGYFQGRESFRVEHMHAQRPRLQGALPGLRARCFVEQKRGDLAEDAPVDFLEVPLQPDSLFLFPELERAIIAHHGKVALREIDGLDLTYLLAGFEWQEDAPRPLDHWQEALRKRVKLIPNPQVLLETADVCPIGWREPTLEAAETVKPLAVRENGAMPPRLTALIGKVKGKQAAAMAAVGLAALPKSVAASADKSDPPEVKEILAEIDKVKDMRPKNQAEAEAFRAQMQVISDKMEALGRGKYAEAESQARSLAEELGYDYDAVVAQGRAEAGAEPDVLAAKLRSIAERAKEGLDPTVKAKLDAALPKDLEGQYATALKDASARQAQLERESAHLLPPPEAMAASKQMVKAKALASALAAKQPPADTALPGMDFSGRKMDGIDLSEANLTAARFVGASLIGAKLGAAGLAHADLTRANFSGAMLKGANLNNARLVRTIFAKADLSGLTFADCEARNTSFAGANLTGTKFHGVKLTGVSFAGADLSKVSFNRCELRGCNFQGATVGNTAFLFCILDQADMRGLQGPALKLINCEAPGIRFQGAKLTNMAVGGKTVMDGADFSGCTMPSCNLSFASLTGAQIRDARMEQANFWQSDLTGADLSGSFLRGAILMRADLTDAVMEGVDAMQANFMKARLVRTHLEAANLYGANFLKTQFDRPNLANAHVEKTRLAGLNMP